MREFQGMKQTKTVNISTHLLEAKTQNRGKKQNEMYEKFTAVLKQIYETQRARIREKLRREEEGIDPLFDSASDTSDDSVDALSPSPEARVSGRASVLNRRNTLIDNFLTSRALLKKRG